MRLDEQQLRTLSQIPSTWALWLVVVCSIAVISAQSLWSKEPLFGLLKSAGTSEGITAGPGSREKDAAEKAADRIFSEGDTDAAEDPSTVAPSDRADGSNKRRAPNAEPERDASALAPSKEDDPSSLLLSSTFRGIQQRRAGGSRIRMKRLPRESGVLSAMLSHQADRDPRRSRSAERAAFH